MTQETNEDLQNQQSLTQDVNEQQDALQNKKVFTEEEVDKLLKERLANKEIEHQRKTESIKKKLEELESKVKAGTATNEEQIESSKAKTAQANSIQQGIHPDALPYIMDEEMAKQKYYDRMNKALESDPEFKKLVIDNKDASLRLVNPDQRYFLRDYENSPQVLKHLLKDKKENNLMQAKWQEMISRGEPSAMVKYLNELSEKLEKSATKPRASSYSPDPDLSDFGDSSQDFDLSKYVSGHR